MKVFCKYLTILSLLMWTNSCSNDPDNYGPGEIEIFFPFHTLSIDLNDSSNPDIISTIHSKNPLMEVCMYIVKGDADEVISGPVRTFFSDTHYSFREVVVWREDMTAVKVTATDKSGFTTSTILPVIITPIKEAPATSWLLEDQPISKITVYEGAPSPLLTAKTIGTADLAEVMVNRVINRREEAIINPITEFDPSNEYNFDLANLIADGRGDIFEPGVTSIKIIAKDRYGKLSVSVLSVNFIELPPPTVSFDNTDVSVDEFDNLTISGSIKSSPETNIARAEYYLIGENKPPLSIANEDFTGDKKTHAFSYLINAIEYGYSGFKVISFNDIGKKMEVILPIAVIEHPKPQIQKPVSNYYGIDKNSTISLSGYSITSSPSNISNVTISTRTLAGVVTEIVNEDTNSASYIPTQSVIADADLGEIIITATNLKGKQTELILPVTVDFVLLRVEIGPERINGSTANNQDSPVIFSSVMKQAVSIKTGFGAQADCDWGTFTSSTGLIGILPISSSTLLSSYPNDTYGLGKWGIRNSTKIKEFPSADVSTETFMSMNADAIKQLVITGTSGYIVSGASANFAVVGFETVARGGKKQRGLIIYNGLSENSPVNIRNRDAIYNITIKLTNIY